MNNPEVDMAHAVQNGNRFQAHSVAMEAAKSALVLVRGIPLELRSLGDQVVRSASSVPANLAEGNGRVGKDRQYHWRVAYGSAAEVATHLELLVAAGAIDGDRTQNALDLFDRTRALIWRLLHPKQ